MEEKEEFGDLSDMLDQFEGRIDAEAETSEVIGGAEVGQEQEPQEEKKTRFSVDLTQTEFKKITSFFLSEPNPLFQDPNYYRNLLENGGPEAANLHKNLNAFVKATDSQEKTMYRGKVISAFWNFLEANIREMILQPTPEREGLVRFGVLNLALMNGDAKLLLSHVILDKDDDSPVYYVDEWLKCVAQNQIGASAGDETKTAVAGNKNRHLESQIQRVEASIQATVDHAKTKSAQRRELEANLERLVNCFLQKKESQSYPGVLFPYDAQQKQLFNQFGMMMQKAKSIDAELTADMNSLERYKENLKQVKGTLIEAGGSSSAFDEDVMKEEFGAIRQMTKMCVGRQGNHFPIFFSAYFVADKNNLGTRENILRILAKIEDIEPGVFKRPYKREEYRIPPYVIAVPCYGDYGICWEPFEKYNRATSRGRIAVPMYPKNLEFAVLTAVADLRWQTAKEKAAQYWMEEGITGNYYQWAYDNKLKGNLKDYFVRDYVIWITKESHGIQKLDKEVRQIFWRYMPFKQEIKDDLRNRGFAYNELYKKDINRSQSDGY